MHLYVCLCRCLKELLDGGAELTKVDTDDNNVLHIACIHGQLDIVQFLLHGKLSPELRYKTVFISLQWLLLVIYIVLTARIQRKVPSSYTESSI